MDGTLTGDTISGQNGLWSDGNEEVIHIPQSLRDGASLSGVV